MAQTLLLSKICLTMLQEEEYRKKTSVKIVDFALSSLNPMTLFYSKENFRYRLAKDCSRLKS